jgi:hypothetical protein
MVILMITWKYENFSNRLINAMKANGYITSRSPNGICIKTLSEFAGASEQICRRYIRGDALPDYDKVIKIARHLNTQPGWLLFGESKEEPKPEPIDSDLLHYILIKSYPLYPDGVEYADNYANFVLKLISDVQEINASKEDLRKIIELAVGSISYKENQRKSAT